MGRDCSGIMDAALTMADALLDAEEILRAAHRLKEHTDKMKAGNA